MRLSDSSAIFAGIRYDALRASNYPNLAAYMDPELVFFGLTRISGEVLPPRTLGQTIDAALRAAVTSRWVVARDAPHEHR